MQLSLYEISQLFGVGPVPANWEVANTDNCGEAALATLGIGLSLPPADSINNPQSLQTT